MKKKLLFVCILLSISNLLFSQIGINSDGSAPNNSAMLDVKSSKKGFLPPRMTRAEIDAISQPADGLIVYCTDCGSNGLGTLSIFMAGKWLRLATAFTDLTVSTTAISSIMATVATSGGNVTSDGGATVTSRGVCWSTIANPTTAASKTTDGTGVGIFTSNLTGLTENTTYYVRAYSTNTYGTSYGNEVTFTTASAAGTVTDIEGNVYKTINIGTQIWMAENLKTTKYSNGDPIPNVTDGYWTSLTTGAYCWYNNDAAIKAIYGGLYNWYAVADSRNIAPTGWHVPTDAEWTTLTTFLGGDAIAGGKLKETGATHWLNENVGATNESGFTDLPGGFRFGDNGAFGYFGNTCENWSNTQIGLSYARHIYMIRSDYTCLRSSADKRSGFSVRCVRD